MAQDWKTVRVFISSTFRDMHSERDYLVKFVFPALREKLEPHRIHLVDIDLRWGITESQAENDEVLDLCLNQIDKCRPFFIGLLGDRYGWVPESLSESKSKHGWTQQHTGKSVTELEIRWGVLLKEEMRDHAFFYFRNPAFIVDVPTAKQAEMDAESPEAAEKLAVLKEEIRQVNPPIPVFENYPCQYEGLRINWRLARFDLDDSEKQALESVAEDGLVDNDEYAAIDVDLRDIVHVYGTVQLTGLEEFGRQVQVQLWEAFCEEFGLDETPTQTEDVDPLVLEQGFHERFMESRLRVYIGRESLQQKLLNYVAGDGDQVALVTGPSGSGKSAALAKFTNNYFTAHSGDLVIPHFVGASPKSSDLRQILHRFCSVLKAEFNFEDEIPPDTSSLITTFKQLITRVPEVRSVVLVIDALNQLDENENAQQLHWLPWQLPAHVKVIVSCIDDPGREEAFLKAFENRNVQRIEVPPLTNEERFEIVQEVPSLSAKSLDPKQIQLLLKNPATQNPLYLLVALEELRGFGSYEQLEKRIRMFPSGEDDVTELFAQVIYRLQDEFDPKDVCDVLSLLASARRGLSDRELLDLIETKGVAISDSQSDLFPILRQLRSYLQYRGELWDFFHRNLSKAIRDQFLSDEASCSATHDQLANYFEAQDYFIESLEDQRARAKRLPPTPRPVNIRKVDELPWQLLQVAKISGKDDPTSPHWEKIADLFTELHFLEAKAEAQP